MFFMGVLVRVERNGWMDTIDILSLCLEKFRISNIFAFEMGWKDGGAAINIKNVIRLFTDVPKWILFAFWEFVITIFLIINIITFLVIHKIYYFTNYLHANVVRDNFNCLYFEGFWLVFTNSWRILIRIP